MHRIDGPGATADKKFTDGNPTTGTAATVVTADWATAVQEEACNLIEAAGLVLNKADNTQLLQAVSQLIAGGGAAPTAAGVSIADAEGYYVGNNVEAALEELGAQVYGGTINTSRLRRSVIALNGAAFSTAANHAEAILEVTNVSAATYTVNPDSTVNLPIGSAITIVQAGAGKVSVAAGSGVTIKKPSVFNAATLGQEAELVLYKTAANTWRLGGMLEAA